MCNIDDLNIRAEFLYDSCGKRITLDFGINTTVFLNKDQAKRTVDVLSDAIQKWSE